MRTEGNPERTPFTIIALAGLIGGLAEVLWVTLYSNLNGTSALEVARQITASVIPAAAGLESAPAIGVVIHLLLSAGLGIAFGWAVWRFVLPHLGAPAIMPAAVVTLALVWAVNFFAVLPVLNPAFVTLMPLAATLFSKMLFGLLMAWILRAAVPLRKR